MPGWKDGLQTLTYVSQVESSAEKGMVLGHFKESALRVKDGKECLSECMHTGRIPGGRQDKNVCRDHKGLYAEGHSTTYRIETVLKTMAVIGLKVKAGRRRSWVCSCGRSLARSGG